MRAFTPQNKHASLPDKNAIYLCHMATDKAKLMATGTVFINNRTQAVRLPAEVRLPEGVKRVDVRVKGAERIISPVGHSWDSFFLDAEYLPSDDFMIKRDDPAAQAREKL
jgi:antitoxin VapB